MACWHRLLVRISGLVGIGISRAWASMLGIIGKSARGLGWSRSGGILCHILMTIGRLSFGKLGGKGGGVAVSAILLTDSPLGLRMMLCGGLMWMALTRR